VTATAACDDFNGRRESAVPSTQVRQRRVATVTRVDVDDDQPVTTRNAHVGVRPRRPPLRGLLRVAGGVVDTIPGYWPLTIQRQHTEAKLL
jgi:hypothetical protein